VGSLQDKLNGDTGSNRSVESQGAFFQYPMLTIAVKCHKNNLRGEDFEAKSQKGLFFLSGPRSDKCYLWVSV
jgi:hypothetical protein